MTKVKTVWGVYTNSFSKIKEGKVAFINIVKNFYMADYK